MGQKQKTEEKERKKGRAKVGANNDQATHGARKPLGPKATEYSSPLPLSFLTLRRNRVEFCFSLVQNERNQNTNEDFKTKSRPNFRNCPNLAHCPVTRLVGFLEFLKMVGVEFAY